MSRPPDAGQPLADTRGSLAVSRDRQGAGSYVFFPGCSLDGTAKDFHRSTLAVAAKLGLDMPELKDWICCGSTAAHCTDPLLADALPAKSLSAAGGSTVAVACAACYSRLKMANHHIAGDTVVRAKVAQVVGSDYDGRTPVRHLLEILCRDIGRGRVARAITRPLPGSRSPPTRSSPGRTPATSSRQRRSLATSSDWGARSPR